MDLIINVVIPIFGIILLGAIAQYYKFLGEGSSEALNNFVYYFAFPVLLFGAMAEEPINRILNFHYIAAFLLGMLVPFFIVYFAYRKFKPSNMAIDSMRAFGASYPNSGYMGIPLLIAMFGKQAILPATIALILTMVLMMLAVFYIELNCNKEEGIGTAIRKIGWSMLKNPLLTAPILGILYAAMGLGLPNFSARFYHILGAAAAPCALFAIGQVLVCQRPKGLAEVSILTIVKLVLQPVLVLGLLLLFCSKPLWIACGVMSAALPTGAAQYVIAQRYHRYEQASASLILFSTVVSVVTLPIFATVIDYLWPSLY